MRSILCVLCAILLIGITSHCSAKLIYDSTGRISFETSNKWHIISLGEDPVTLELVSIALDKDTCITFKQSKYEMGYKSMRSLSQTDKSILRDMLLQFHIDLFKSKGYAVIVNKTEYLDDSILMGFSLRKDFSVYRAVGMYFVKDYICYSIFATTTDANRPEIMRVISTLKIDSIPIKQWILK